jgi:hypothetical protein
LICQAMEGGQSWTLIYTRKSNSSPVDGKKAEAAQSSLQHGNVKPTRSST